MTYQASESTPAHHADAGSAALPAIGASVLAVIWGLYTALIVFEIATSPLPQL